MKMECEYCEGAKALVIGKTDKSNNDDYGIAIHYATGRYCLMAYGYDVHGSGSNSISVQINYCPMCGRDLTKWIKPEEQ